MTEKEAAFLAEYEALCRKHEMFVGACGCCGSPWAVSAGCDTFRKSPAQELDEHIAHLRG